MTCSTAAEKTTWIISSETIEREPTVQAKRSGSDQWIYCFFFQQLPADQDAAAEERCRCSYLYECVYTNYLKSERNIFVKPTCIGFWHWRRNCDNLIERPFWCIVVLGIHDNGWYGVCVVLCVKFKCPKYGVQEIQILKLWSLKNYVCEIQMREIECLRCTVAWNLNSYAENNLWLPS